MAEYDFIVDYLIPIMSIFAMAMATSFNVRTHDFSQDTFMASVAIGIALVIWIGMFPYYAIIISVFILVGMLFTRGNDFE